MPLRSRSAFHRPPIGLSRRTLLAGGVGVGAMFALAACSGEAPTPAPSRSRPPSTAPVAP